MGQNLPPSLLGQIEWFENRLDAWTATPIDIGLASGQVLDLTNLVTAARTAYTSAQSARASGKSITRDFYSKTTAMRDYGGDLIATIKAFAAATDNPEVYLQAEVSPKDPPSPAPAPGMPQNLSAELRGNGALRLTWKAGNAAASSGSFFNIFRKLAGQSSFALLASTGEKSYNDITLPQGVSDVTYYLMARRGDLQSPPSPQLTVQFGIGPAGQTSFTSIDQDGGGDKLGLAA